jgi:hypothetical protein
MCVRARSRELWVHTCVYICVRTHVCVHRKPTAQFWALTRYKPLQTMCAQVNQEANSAILLAIKMLGSKTGLAGANGPSQFVGAPGEPVAPSTVELLGQVTKP